MEPNSVSTSTDEATIPHHSAGPSYQEVTDRVLSEYHGGFQDQYVQSLLLGENNSIEDEFCSLNSSLDMTQNSQMKRVMSKSSQIKVTEKRQKCEDKNFNVEESINQNTIQGISSLQNVRRSQLLQTGSCTVATITNTSEEKELKNVGFHQKRLKIGTELQNMQTIVKSKESVTSKTVVEGNSIIKEDKCTNKVRKDDQSKCNLCKKKFGYYDECKIKRHKKLPHHIPCSNCNLMFVDEFDLNKHVRKFHRSGETNDYGPYGVKYDYECRKCLKISRSFSSNIKHEKLSHPYACKICVDEKLQYPFSFIDKIGLKHHTKYMHNAETTELVTTKDTHNMETTELVTTKDTTELFLQGPTKNVHNAETTGELVPTKDTHNVETRAEVVSNKHLEADDSEEDSNKDCDDILLPKKHLEEDASEQDSNKDCDDVKVIVVVPKIIKGATSLGRLKIKQYFNIKKEQDDQVDQMNETCTTQENISQDHGSYASIESNNTLEVENTCFIEIQTRLEENNVEKVNADVCMTTNNNFECLKNNTLLDENNSTHASKYQKLPSTSQVQQQQQHVATTVKSEAVVSYKSSLYNQHQNRGTSIMACPINLTSTPAADQLLEKSVGTLPTQGSFPNMGKRIDVNSTPIMTGSGGISMKIPTDASRGTITNRPAMTGRTGIYTPARPAMTGRTGIYTPIRPSMAGTTGIYTPLRPSMAGTTMIYAPDRPSMASTNGIYTPVRPSMAGTTGIYTTLRPSMASTTGIYTPLRPAVAATTRIYAPVRSSVAGTSSIYAPVGPALASTTGMNAPVRSAMAGTTGIYTPIRPSMAGTIGIYTPVRPSMAISTEIYTPIRPSMAGTTGIYTPIRPSMAGTTGIYTPIRPSMAGTTGIYTPIRPSMAGTTGIYTPVRPAMAGTTGIYNRGRMANPSSRGTIPINPAMHTIRGRAEARMRGAAGVRFMRGMRQRMPLAHKEAQTRPQVKVPVAPIRPRKLGAPNRTPQLGAPNRPQKLGMPYGPQPVGLVQPAVPGRMEEAPFSDIPRLRMTQPVRRGRVGLKTRGGSVWRPVPPTAPETSGAKATLANTSKPKKVELIDLSDDNETSPPVSVNPAIARLKNCGISVTKLLNPTVPQDARLPSGITLVPAPLACRSTERTNTESRDNKGNGSSSTLSSTNIPALADQGKVNLNTLTLEQKKKLPLTPEQKEKLKSLGLL